MAETKQVRVRIAPSPTGDPHVGTAYVALFNFIFAKKHGGSFILRIEDTDQTRAKSSSEENILSSLRWLGLEWDEGPDKGGPKGPYRQSERRDIYREYADRLICEGKAYRCFCTAERLNEVREKQKQAKEQTRYDRHCLGLSEDELKKNLDQKVPHVVRLRMPAEGKTQVNDLLRGTVDFDNERIDDQVLLKSDGFPTYHLANVVDDHLMEVSHVIRAEEWISSTPKHVQLYKAFGWEEPVWVHLPLLRNTDKSKISKRKNPVSLTFYQRAGYLPEALLNFLALMGWNPGNDVELFDQKEMMNSFELEDVNLGDPVFDMDKLNWMNQQYVQKIEAGRFTEIMRNQFFDPVYLGKIWPLVCERLERFDEFFEKHAFFFNGKLSYDGLPLIPKGRDASEVRKAFKGLVEKLDEVYEWNAETLKGVIDTHKDEIGWKPKDFFMPLRLIATGRKDSPPLVETLEVLGRDVVRYRIRDAISSAAMK